MLVDDGSAEDFFVEVDVGGGGRLVVEALFGFVHDAMDDGVFIHWIPAEEFDGFVDGPAQALAAVVLEAEAVAEFAVVVEVVDGVVDAACIVDDWQGAIEWCGHLWEAAWLEARRHDDEVRTCVGEAGEWLIEGLHGDDALEVVHLEDIFKVPLEVTAGDDGDLETDVCVVSSELVEDFSE